MLNFWIIEKRLNLLSPALTEIKLLCLHRVELTGTHDPLVTESLFDFVANGFDHRSIPLKLLSGQLFATLMNGVVYKASTFRFTTGSAENENTTVKEYLGENSICVPKSPHAIEAI